MRTVKKVGRDLSGVTVALIWNWQPADVS